MLQGRVQEHRVGQGFSLYYIAHAAYLELRGSYARADAVLQEGERRCAAAALGSTCARSGARARACLRVPAGRVGLVVLAERQCATVGLASMPKIAGLHRGGLSACQHGSFCHGQDLSSRTACLPPACM